MQIIIEHEHFMRWRESTLSSQIQFYWP